uniref:Protein kinase domain-containing protein n=1 Tax=Davidia involucrata TaxID=16924 RepID=A0A5B7BY07_DAVIN
MKEGQQGDVSLRQWLDKPDRIVDLQECLHIFRQVVEIANLAHSQGIVICNIRPSCFVMTSFNHVSFIKSASCTSSGSDSYDNALNQHSLLSHRGLHQQQSWLGNEDSTQVISPSGTSRIASRNSSLHSSSIYMSRLPLVEENKLESQRVAEIEEIKQAFPLKQILLVEINWYTSPEELAGAPNSFSSDIYRLGVLLFELFSTFSSTKEKLSTMSNLRYRVLPPQLLLKWPKEASFCLWLLHPQTSIRPKMSEVLQSEFLNEQRENWEEHEAAIKLGKTIEEQELLLEFLLQVKQRKQEAAEKLHEALCCVSSDFEEVMEQQIILKRKGSLHPEVRRDDLSALSKVVDPFQDLAENEDFASLGSRKSFRTGLRSRNVETYDEHLDEYQKSETCSANQGPVRSKGSHFMKNFKMLESAYFSTRCRPIKPTGKPLMTHSSISSAGKGSNVSTERSSVDNLASKVRYSEARKSRWINPFLEGLCKYLSYSELKVRAELKQGDLLNSSNLVCSLSFDRDRELFATAGVDRKIKVFECDTILNESCDIHYPVIEMACRSKLSSICWNSYIKSQIASSDFEGVVQVWDVARSQVFMEMREHERRVWSVDFSSADPMKLASGSDDGAVKLWNINQGGSIETIRTKANVCCVQFAPDSARSLAIGSADHKVYFYDLRNTRMPLFTLSGHNKTVSYVKFLDSTSLVSASTDNSLKLWDLSMYTSQVLDGPLQTFTGHMNVKNFVGLSISDGYIATGSETNEVVIYHKAFPMPMLSFKFDGTDALSGHIADDAAKFISSVSWRGQSNTLLAANSAGNIKLLEMV